MPAILGDVDGNGNVEGVDALIVMRYAMGILDELENPEAANVNGDENVDLMDALIILRMAMGIIQ